MRTRFAFVTTLIAAGTTCVAGGAAAQIIPVRTIPIAESEQFSFFPTAGRTNMSMVLVDSLLDPFSNPARAALIGRSTYFGAPSFFSVTGNAGGGTTFPMGGLWRRGSMFGGLAIAFQQIERPERALGGFDGGFVELPSSSFAPIPATPSPPSSLANRYGLAMLGQSFDSAGVSVGGSVLWSNLRAVDGTHQFYSGNTSLSQLGDAIDMRLGVTKTLGGGRSVEAMVVRNRFRTDHAVGFTDLFWDPATRSTQSRPRTERNGERTDVWGMHVEYEHPLDSGWRMGALATANRIRHPRIPSYAVTSGLGSEGRATAYNAGVGIGRTHKLVAFGVDAIYEPISNRSWIEDTVRNEFRFHNAKLRGGVSRDFAMLTPGSYVRLQFGAEYHWINYALTQDDRLNSISRSSREHWLERGRSGGVSFITHGVQVHYLVTNKDGVGRLGVVNTDNVIFTDALVSTSVWGGPPMQPVSLGAVSVTRHLFSLSVPVR